MATTKRKSKVPTSVQLKQLKDRDLLVRLTAVAVSEDRKPIYIMRRILNQALPVKTAG